MPWLGFVRRAWSGCAVARWNIHPPPWLLLDRAGMEAVADVDGDGAGILRADDEVGDLVGHDGDGERRRHQDEQASLALFESQPGEHRQEALHGRVERPVDLGEMLHAGDV